MRVAVVGRGLIGSAAARHLADMGHEVLLIGPDEPLDKRSHQGVFGSHYDEGRITRRLATDEFWSAVSRASIDRYAEIEQRSEIPFFTARGAMMAGPADHSFTHSAESVSKGLGQDVEALCHKDLSARSPFFSFPDDTIGFYEKSCGHISPRNLVAAQTKLAIANGTRHVRSVATSVREIPGGVEIETLDGQVVAERLLIATGAFTDHVAPIKLNQRVYARTVAFFEVSTAEADRLASMPSLVFRLQSVAGEPYLLPPIRYPDARILVDLGGDPFDRQLHTQGEINDWFRSGGDPEVRAHLEATIRRLMPELAIDAVTMEACVTTFTPTGYPTIDQLSDRVFVASGGNGAGAKCSDELGRAAAVVSTDGVNPYPQTRRS